MIFNLEIGLSESKIIRFRIIVEPKMQSLIKHSRIRLSRNSAAKPGRVFSAISAKKRQHGGGQFTQIFKLTFWQHLLKKNKIHVKEKNLEILVFI